MSNEKKDKFVPIPTLIVYSIIFYSAWTAFHFAVEPALQSHISNPTLVTFIGDGIIKNLLWTLPAVLLIAKYRDKVSVGLGDMFKWKKENNKYLLLFPAFAAYIILELVIRGGKPGISDEFGMGDIITVFFVGLTEEFVFRGWLLNSTVKRNENAAIAINSLMFLLIHFPIWITSGEFVTNITNFGFVCIIALSVLFSVIFLKTRNILLPILLHSFWDLLIFMMY